MQLGQGRTRLASVLLHLLVYVAVGMIFSFRGQPILQAAPFCIVLIWISVIDFERQEIPDAAAVLLAGSGLTVSAMTSLDLGLTRLSGAVIWGSLFWGVATGYRRLRGRHGLGLGDAKLIAGIAAWCGGVETVQVVLIGTLSGIAAIVARATLQGRHAHLQSTSSIAFGPFLCLPAWTIWLDGTTL